MRWRTRLAGLGSELVVVAAEGDDAHLRIEPGEAGQAIAREAGAADEEGGRAALALRLDLDRPAGATDRRHRGAGAHLAAGGANLRGQGLGHRDVVDDAGLGHEQTGDAGGVRLVLAQLRPSSRSIPTRPFSRPRRSSSSRRGSSLSATATTTLPQRSCAMPFSSAQTEESPPVLRRRAAP